MTERLTNSCALPLELTELVASYFTQRRDLPRGVQWCLMNGIALRRQSRSSGRVRVPMALWDFWMLVRVLDCECVGEIARRLQGGYDLPNVSKYIFKKIGNHRACLTAELLNRTAGRASPAAAALRRECARYVLGGWGWSCTISTAVARGHWDVVREWLPQVELNSSQYSSAMMCAAAAGRPTELRWLAARAPPGITIYWKRVAAGAVEGDSPECFEQCLAAGMRSDFWAIIALCAGKFKVAAAFAHPPSAIFGVARVVHAHKASGVVPTFEQVAQVISNALTEGRMHRAQRRLLREQVGRLRAQLQGRQWTGQHALQQAEQRLQAVELLRQDLQEQTPLKLQQMQTWLEFAHRRMWRASTGN